MSTDSQGGIESLRAATQSATPFISVTADNPCQPKTQKTHTVYTYT